MIMLHYTTLWIDLIKTRLEKANDWSEFSLRTWLLNAEYDFFRENIKNKDVLVAWSWLWHDAFYLSYFNNNIVWFDLIESFVNYAIIKKKYLNIKNVDFLIWDIHNLSFLWNKKYNVSILNMWTLWNFDDIKSIIYEMLKFSDKFYFDFYSVNKTDIIHRKKMYDEEWRKNVKIQWDTIVSDDWLYSRSLSEKYISSIVSDLGAIVKFYKIHNFTILAEVIKNNLQ